MTCSNAIRYVARKELLPTDSCKHISLSISTSLFHTATIKITQETALQTFVLGYNPSRSVQEDVTGLSSMAVELYRDLQSLDGAAVQLQAERGQTAGKKDAVSELRRR